MELTVQIRYVIEYDDNDLTKEELRELVELLVKERDLRRAFGIYFAMKNKHE